ncbi:probable disease resistance protein At5g66900 isoform X2 [Rhododendron vialii]|uniref:probable disease resistance protein At5g66900 isoform X2 n=1 Tax=Rhododendron vialii TaxID=182163 RepID=UPI00265FD372|nr:probable disease resistance protein At5g66900 isoform X2 [Rhododendron vialii]
MPSMTPADVGGAFLGAVFGQVLKIVEEVTIKSIEFKPHLKRLQLTLNQIAPIIEDIEKLDRVLDRPPIETKMLADKLEEGKRLVQKCAKVRRWNLCAKTFYANKLIAFDKSLERLFNIDVTAQISRDSRKIQETVNVIDGRLERIETRVGGSGGVCKSNTNGFVGCCLVPKVGGFVVGFEEPVREVKALLMSGGEQQVVVVSAPGGCGKTTLAKMVGHDEEIKGMFKDNIFFVTAPKAPSLKVVIESLFEHSGVQVPEFQTDEDAVYQLERYQLERMLKQIGPYHILLVLDDVWSGWESLIEDLTTQIPEIKILVTSRFVFPRFESTYKLKLLGDKDAMALFRHSAFPKDGRSSIPDDLVDKIVRGCGGFPLVLEVVGRSLYGKPKEIWKRTLKQWSEKSIFSSESNNEILIRLQTSLNSLDEMSKECYLDLASFPEDRRIPAMALIDMWVGLYNLDEDDEEAIAILHELSLRSLVDQVVTRKDASEISGYYNEHFATQHDLLRELAIHQCSQELIENRKRLIIEIEGNDFPRWWIEQGQHSICPRLVSISTDERFSSNWHDMHLPEAEVLVLNIQTRNYTLPQFMEKMDQLKVLIISNYGFSSSEIQNIPLLGYLSSLKRIRLEHVFISSISDSILKLRNLQKISFIMCEISEAFRKCTIQIPDMLPYLSEIVIDYCNDLVEFPACLCEIRSLKELSITNCHELVTIAEEFEKLENLKVLRLHACTKLLEVPETIGSLKKLVFLDIADCISMSKLPGRIGDLCGLRNIHMRGCQGLSELPLSVKGLEKLKNVTCDEETGCLWQQFKDYLDDLEIHVHKEDVNLDWLY